MNNSPYKLPVGAVLNGKYTIRSHLSSGGFGNTYLAVYGPRSTKVAIKEFFMKSVNLRGTDSLSVIVDMSKEDAKFFPSQLAKFKKEYERLKLIRNVHVVKVHDLFEENGTAYYVMDFVEGDNLEARLEKRGNPYREKTVLQYLNQILDGLSAIHSKGFLHLDIKPSNIMRTTRGYMKLIDLGASKEYMLGAGATKYSGVALTNRYAPPEQVDGSFEKLGPWTDFYALGATVYRLLTCRDIPSWSTINEDKTQDKHIALPMPGVSAKTKRLVVWMMNTDRTKRPRNVKEILKRMNSKPENKHTHKSSEETIIKSAKEDKATLEVSKLQLLFDAKKGYELVLITANKEWSVECNASWIHLNTGGTSVKVGVDENSGPESRTALCYVKSGNLSRPISISQNGMRPNASCQSKNNSSSIGNSREQAQKATQEKEPEFSFVGCLYILIIIAIIIAIIVYVIKQFLFFT